MMSITRNILAIVAACAGTVYALPPPTAQSYTATYKQVMKEKDDDGEDKTYTEKMTISVSKDHSRWQRERDLFTTITDKTSNTVTTYGGSLPPQTAVRAPSRPAASWEFGYGNIASASVPPKEGAKETIAGKSCTVLEFDSKQYGKPKLCVTDEGVVARFLLDDPDDGSVTTYEAETITVGEPPADTFAVPTGYNVETPSKR
jgi:hypothetical protein